MLCIWFKFRNWTLLLPALFSAYSCFIFSFNETIDWGLANSGFYYAYAILFVISFTLFLIYGHILSAGFTLFLVIIGLDFLASQGHETISLWWNGSNDQLSAPFSFLHYAFNYYTPNFIHTLIFLLAATFLRIFYLAWRDNKDLYAQLSKSDIKDASIKTLRIWWPMLAIFAVFTVGYEFLFSTAENRASCSLQKEIAVETCDEAIDLEQALQRFAAFQINKADAHLQSGIQDANSDIKSRSAETPRQVSQSVRKHTAGRLPGTATKRCGFLDVFCLISNGIKSMANSSYQRAREKSIRSMERELAKSDENIQGNADQFAAKAQSLTGSVSSTTNSVAGLSIASVFLTYKTLSTLMLIYSIMILFKSFLVIFGRVIFDPKRNPKISAQFRPDEGPKGQVKLTLKGSGFKVPKAYASDRYYCFRDIQLSGPPPARTFPLGIRFFLTRVLSKRVSFKFVEGGRSGSTNFAATISIDPPQEIVEWKLRDGERVFFKFKDLVGFDGNTTFKRVASLSLSTLILGRIIVYHAEGPGTILLKTRAAPELSVGRGAIAPFEPRSLVAWNSAIRFYVDARLTIVDTLLSSFNIHVEKGEHYLRDKTDAVDDGMFSGVLKFAANFLLPI